MVVEVVLEVVEMWWWCGGGGGVGICDNQILLDSIYALSGMFRHV